MSWKASAYVKEITRGITPSEKVVLFVLADYHNTAHKAAWPSLVELAEQSLITKVGLCRILDRLEKKGFIERVAGGGKGNRTEYRLPGLDGKQSPTVTVTENQTVTEMASNSNPNSNPGHTPNKEVEPVLEPQTSNALSSPPVPTGEFELSEPNPSSRKKKQSTADPRHSQFIELLSKGHKHFLGVAPLITGATTKNLSRLLAGDKTLSEARFRKMLTNYYESEDHPRGDPPHVFLLRLPRYEFGNVNKYGREVEAMGIGS